MNLKVNTKTLMITVHQAYFPTLPQIVKTIAILVNGVIDTKAVFLIPNRQSHLITNTNTDLNQQRNSCIKIQPNHLESRII